METQAEYGGGLDKQRQAPGRITVEKLTSVSQIRDVLNKIGGHNLLNEKAMFDRVSGEEGAWLGNVQSEIIDGGGVALEIREDGETIGFALADKEGVITRFTSLAGKEAEALDHACEDLKDRGFEEISVRLTGESEYMRGILHEKEFKDSGEEKDGKHVMRKH
jgi:hypothetical protein